MIHGGVYLIITSILAFCIVRYGVRISAEKKDEELKEFLDRRYRRGNQ